MLALATVSNFYDGSGFFLWVFLSMHDYVELNQQKIDLISRRLTVGMLMAVFFEELRKSISFQISD